MWLLLPTILDVDVVVLSSSFSTLSTTTGTLTITCLLHCRTTLFTLCTDISLASVSLMLLGCPDPHSFVPEVGTDSVVVVVAIPVSVVGPVADLAAGVADCVVLLEMSVYVALAVFGLALEQTGVADCWELDLSGSHSRFDPGSVVDCLFSVDLSSFLSLGTLIVGCTI